MQASIINGNNRCIFLFFMTWKQGRDETVRQMIKSIPMIMLFLSRGERITPKIPIAPAGDGSPEKSGEVFCHWRVNRVRR